MPVIPEVPLKHHRKQAKPRRDLLVLSCGLLVCALPSCAGRKTPKRPAIDGFTIDGPRISLPQIRRGVELFAPIGNIRIHSSPEAWLEKSYSVSAADLETARLIVQNATVETRQLANDRTLISLVPPSDCPFEALAADSMLSIPSRLDLDLRTINGLIDTRNYSAKQATLRTRDGNLLIGSVEDELRFESDSGRVELYGTSSRVSGKTTDGEIHVNSLASASSLELESRSGTVTVHISPVVPTQIIYRTKTGALRIECDEKNLDRRAVPRDDDWTERRIRFVGAAAIAKPCLVVVESQDGDLVLARPPEARPPMPGRPVAGTR